MLEVEWYGKQVCLIYVYEVLVWLWYWINVLVMVVMVVIGYFIGKFLLMMFGEVLENFLMGYICFVYFVVVYIFVVGLFGCLYWVFVGNYYVKQIFKLLIINKVWWKEVLFELCWYLFFEKILKKYVGYNLMVQLMMFFFFYCFCCWYGVYWFCVVQ